MSLSAKKREQLSAFLGSLSNAVAAKLFSALEYDRVRTSSAASASGVRKDNLPYDLLLDDLRAQLLERGAVLPGRMITAKRVFFTPVENFLIGAHGSRKRDGQIARRSLDPIWRLLQTDSALTEASMAAAALDAALSRNEETGGHEQGLKLAAEAGIARVLRRAHDDPAARRELVNELGGETALEDLRELRILLAGAPYWEQLKTIVPNAAPSLSEEQIFQLRSLFLSAVEEAKSFGVYLLLALKGRLEKPWRSLGVYYNIAQSADDRVRAVRDIVEALPESLFQDIEDVARDLERRCSQPLDGKAIMIKIDYFVDYSDGLLRQAARIGDNVFANRVEACRDIVAEAHMRFCEQSLSALRAAMPVRHAGGSSRLMSLRPDIYAPFDSALVDGAATGAELLAGAEETARRLGEDDSFARDTADEARRQLQIYLKDLVAEIRAAEGESRDLARRLFEASARYAAPLLSRDEIGLFRDRAAAAAVAV